MKKPQYRLMRKVKGTHSWRTCCLSDGDKVIKGGVTSDKQVALQNKKEIEALFPEETYAILEL